MYFAACFKLMLEILTERCIYVHVHAQMTRKRKIPMTVSGDSVNVLCRLLMLKYLLRGVPRI